MDKLHDSLCHTAASLMRFFPSSFFLLLFLLNFISFYLGVRREMGGISRRDVEDIEVH